MNNPLQYTVMYMFIYLLTLMFFSIQIVHGQC